MKQFYTLLLSIFLVVLGNAKSLTPQQALERLGESSIVKKSRGLDDNALKLVMTGKTETGESAYYVFRGDNASFILSADDIAEPVLGYTLSSDFSSENMPPAMKWWLEMYAQEIQYATANLKLSGYSLNSNNKKIRKSSHSGQEIAPMLTTIWNQGAPFNQYCPSIGGTKCVTGCVATSMAQIMNYFRWPQSSVSPISYNWNGRNLTSPAVTLDWGNMIDSYNNSYTSTQADAVARLMQLAGYSVLMDYNTAENGGSAANPLSIRRAFVDIFGYDGAAELYMRDYFSNEEWKDKIYKNLLNVGPVLYNGSGDEGGHSFVCDGYDGEDYFHFNWGWGGHSDGYFLLSALDPLDIGIGGGNGGFNYFQNAVTGIQRPQSGVSTPIPYMGCSTNLEGDIYDNYLQLKASEDGGFFNLGSITANFTFGASLTNIESGNEVYLECDNIELESFSGITYYWIEIPSSLAFGRYTVRPAYKVDSQDWEYIHFQKGYRNSFNIEKSSGGIEILEDEEVITLIDWNCPTGFISGQDFSGELTVESTYSYPVDYSLDAYLCVLENSESLMIVENLGSDTITIPSYSNATMHFSGTLSDLEPGNYYLVFAQEMKVVGYIEVEVYKNTSVTITNIKAEADSDVRYYDLRGLEISKGNPSPGMYIKKDGGKTMKIMVRN